jgi:3-oxoacyl-[acyl-carrier protein] reductase
MKLFTAFLLASTAAAFAPATPLSFATRGASSSMQMVADDAKVCLVTGSSRGLGKAIALELGKAGQKVVVNFVSDGSKESADATVEEIKALGGDAIAVQADSKLVMFVLCADVALYVCLSTSISLKAPYYFERLQS